MADNRTENAQFTYQATQISTATKEQLLLITYDIAIRSCRLAEAALSEDEKTRDTDLAHREIIRAEDVIRELMVTLNTDKGGEMAQALMSLYDFMYQQLVDANLRKDPKLVHTVRGMLEELKATWEEALLKLLKDYQAAHPEDEDLKAVSGMKVADLSNVKGGGSTMSEPSAAVPAAPGAYAAQPKPQASLPVPTAPQKAGGLNIAG